MTAVMIKQCTLQLERQRESIIKKLKSSEDKLLENIKLNPKLWNTECISIEVNPKKTDLDNFGFSFSIELNAIERATKSNDPIQDTTISCNQEKTIDLTGEVRKYAYILYQYDCQYFR